MDTRDKSLSEGVKSWDWQDVPVNKAFGYYREGICAAFMPLCADVHHAARRDFRFSMRSHCIENSRVNIVRANQHSISRGRAEIEASPDACYYLNLQQGGVCRVRQGDDEMTLSAGDLGIFDSEQAMELNHDLHSHLAVASIMVPKEQLSERIDSQLIATIQKPRLLSNDPALGQLAGDLASSMITAVETGLNPRAQRLQNMLFDIVAEILSPQPLREMTGSHAVRRLRIQQTIVAQCRDTNFNLNECARQLALSARAVQRSLATDYTTFSETLRAARFACAIRALENPLMAEMPVNSIALDSGFRDSAHFSRVFKVRYGITPGEWRARRRTH